MHISKLAAVASIASAAAAASAAAPRFVMYYDQWHKLSAQPPKDVVAGITHVITAFAESTIFATNPPASFTPFVNPDTLRGWFDPGTKMCLAVGGWGLSTGFNTGQKTPESRALYAQNVAATLKALGYDCVDIDWEYPGGNGEDYITSPNSEKLDEIENYPLFLQAIKDAIGDKELSIAVPGREGDMIAFTADKVPNITKIVDFVNVMAYDLMNRRDNVTNHHTSVQGSLQTVQKYLDLGMDAAKMNLGIAFYAKWFTTSEDCSSKPIGCKTVPLEDNGEDTEMSGPVTFAEGVPVRSSGVADKEQGGEWYYDAQKSQFWTWDTPEFIAQKFEKIIKAKNLGGVMGWALGDDLPGFDYIKAMEDGVNSLKKTPSSA
ncbi:glycoside hydrolase family 18 protein [Xylariaceae sp. FL0594]|nr:glycoside hydrolase family 18 protein [Xylariaceae sp. FL0594]